MQIEIKKLPDSEIEITGEIEAGDFESCRQTAMENISKEIKMDGFRPGKIPEKILIEKIGENSILEETAETALRKFYPKILAENKIHAIGRPEIIITKIARNNPLGFKIKTAIMPEIELADYKKIAKEAMADKNEKTPEARAKRRMEIIEKIMESSKMEIPKIILEEERNRDKDIKEEDVIKRIKFSFVLDEIAEREKIEVSENEWRPESQKLISSGIDENKIRYYTYGILRNEKVFQFLESC